MHLTGNKDFKIVF